MKKIIKTETITTTHTTLVDVEKWVVGHKEFTNPLEAMKYEADLDRNKNFETFYKVQKVDFENGNLFVINYIPKSFSFEEVIADIRKKYGASVDSDIKYPCKLIVRETYGGDYNYFNVTTPDILKKDFQQWIDIIEWIE